MELALQRQLEASVLELPFLHAAAGALGGQARSLRRIVEAAEARAELVELKVSCT